MLLLITNKGFAYQEMTGGAGACLVVYLCIHPVHQS